MPETVPPIKRYREALGYTQTDLARLCCVSQQVISVWEKGKLPKKRLRPVVARALRIEVKDLEGLGE